MATAISTFIVSVMAGIVSYYICRTISVNGSTGTYNRSEPK